MTESVRVLIPEEEVNKRIKEMAEKISADIGDETITLICILKGSVFFSCELAKNIKGPVMLDFMSVTSYGDDTKSSGVKKYPAYLLVSKQVLSSILFLIDFITSSETSGECICESCSTNAWMLSVS